MNAVKHPLAVAVVLGISGLSTSAFAADEPVEIERLTILGSKQAVDELPGSGYYMTEAEMEAFEFTDIHRALGRVPGVYVLEEDGYGLRPNIGMRGTGVSRSDKITVMEDNVIAAPAPYASPAAYYFPTFGRMQALEVIKGSSSVAYGPRTTGGVLNLVSRSVPETDLAGALDVAGGRDGYGKAHAWVGGSGERVGGVFELFRYQADGFKDLPNGDDTGFYKNDFMGKVRVQLDEAGRHQLTLKMKYSDESSDETYLGLTDADFEATPYVRYSASQLDNMATEHRQLQANYQYSLRNGAVFSAVAYRNEFDRNWYKVASVDGASLGGGAEQIASDFDANPQGELALDVKANNRMYVSEGVQASFTMPYGDHELTFGGRVHEDEMDRFQWVDSYALDAAFNTQQTNAGIPGTDSNRIDSAEALALFVNSEWVFSALTLEAGLRYEDIDTMRRDWGKTNPGRNGSVTPVTNSTDIVLPAVGATYRLNDNLVVLAGVQKGFAPAAPGNDVQENEESWNYEAGLRYRDQGFSSEFIAFVSDYSNMHGNCTAAQGCDLNNIDDQYNAGEVTVQGVEVLGEYRMPIGVYTFVFDAAATFTDTEFNNDFASNLGIWGDVVAGDELPYQADTQYRFGASLLAGQWTFHSAVRYIGDMRTVAGQGDYSGADRIDARTVVDFSAHYQLDSNQRVYATIDNLLDEDYAATRTNGGIQVGKPRSFQVGYQYSF